MGPLDYLFGLEQHGIKLGLDNIGALCEAQDHPEQSFASILVAGTNGKGSVAAMLDTALRVGRLYDRPLYLTSSHGPS